MLKRNRGSVLISYIKGNVAYIDEEGIVVDNNGMGYLVRTPDQIMNRFKTGQEIMLYTYLYIREDAVALYGFMTREELKTFKILLTVNGVGPRIALAVLSSMSVEELYYAVISDDSKAISKTPGIGTKGAKKIILELKGKLNLSDIGIDEEGVKPSDSGSINLRDDNIADAISALVALGYSNTQAYRAVTKVTGAESMGTEKLLKEALKMIMIDSI